MGLVGDAVPPAPRLPPAPWGEPGEEADQEKSKGKQTVWICLLGTVAADANCLRERAEITALSPPRRIGRGLRVGERPFAAEVFGAAGPGVPRDVALNRGSRTGRSSPAPSGQSVPPIASACVASGLAARPAFAWLPGLILLGGIKVGN